MISPLPLLLVLWAAAASRSGSSGQSLEAAPEVQLETHENTCDMVAGLKNISPETLQMARDALVYSKLSTDLESPPDYVGSSYFLKALIVSTLPARIESEMLYSIKEAVRTCREAWEISRLDHQKRCREVALVSEPINLEYFVDERHHDREYFEFSMKQLQRHETIIQISGDGNCLYRAFLFGLLQLYMKASGPGHQQRRDLYDRLRTRLSMLYQERYPQVRARNAVLEAGLALLLLCLENATLFSVGTWRDVLNSHRASDAMIHALRVIAADMAQAPQYSNFISGGIQRYIDTRIMPMGEWAGDLEAICLANFFEVTLTITDLTEQRRIPSSNWIGPEQTAEIEVLFNGTHYDLYNQHDEQ